MRVPTGILKSVGFFARVLSKGTAEEKNFRGTGFIVSVPPIRSSGEEFRHHVVVTARHVAEQLSLGDWVMRLNTTTSGGIIDIRSDKHHRWYFHPTDKDNVDVAVSGFIIPSPPVHVGAVRVECFLTDEHIQDAIIGPGDQVFTVGLFTKMLPQLKHRPIVRSGNVAMIAEPGDRLSGIRIGNSVVESEVHLIESRSIGGLSGSPVFARSTVKATIPVVRKGIVRPEICRFPGDFFLLGLAQGHWDILPEDKNEAAPRGRDSANPDAVNLGIAVVVPAKKIRETIYCQEMIELRRTCEERFAKIRVTTRQD